MKILLALNGVITEQLDELCGREKNDFSAKKLAELKEEGGEQPSADLVLWTAINSVSGALFELC